MSINKWYEIYCNWCGSASHHIGSIRFANETYKAEGGIVRDKKHYCDELCEEKSKKFEQSEAPDGKDSG